MPTEPSQDPFWEIWQSYRCSLHQQSLRLTRGNRDEARELLSTAMLRAAQKFPQHSKNIKNMKAWLHQLLHNVCMDAMKEQQRLLTAGPVHLEDEAEEEFLWSEEQSSPEELLMRQERVRWMWQRVQQLPESLRAPLVMRFGEGLSYPEIAERLALTHCNTRKRIQIACERMRGMLVSES